MQSELIITNPARLLSPAEPLKQCKKKDCLQFKPLSSFAKQVHYADGYKTWCRECETRYSREWRNKKRLDKNLAIILPVDAPIRAHKEYASRKTIEPSTLPSDEIIKNHIAYELRHLKKWRRQEPVNTEFPMNRLLGMKIIRKDDPVASSCFLGHRIKDAYISTVEEEFISKDEFCYGEPRSSFMDFIKGAGEVRYLMTLDEDGNYLHERVLTEESISEVQFRLEGRPELLQVA